jgi:hypothetical protein
VITKSEFVFTMAAILRVASFGDISHVQRLSTISGLRSSLVAFGPRAGITCIAAGATGLLLRISAPAPDRLSYDIVLVLGLRGERVLVADAAEECAVALWRRMAGDLGQQLLIEIPGGSVASLSEQIGLVQNGERHERRRVAALTKRRPWFLKRRKAARLPERPVMVRGREIPRG